jgi:hypothetical protein
MAKGLTIPASNQMSVSAFCDGTKFAWRRDGSRRRRTSDNQMVETMEQLIANLSAYPANAASAYNKAAADTSPPTANVNSVA